MRPAGAVVLAGALLAGCGGASPAPGPPAAAGPPADAPATAELRQLRSDRALHRLEVTVTAREPLTATRVALVAEGFAPLPPTAVDTALPVGSALDLPVPYGAPDCDAAPGRATATVTTVERGDVVLPLDDGGLVARLHEAECSEQALLAAVEVTVAGTLVETVEDGRPVLTGALRLQRRQAGERVVLDGLGANVVLTVRSDGGQVPLRVLGPDEPSLEVPLVLSPSRCEAHALAESKRTSLVTAYLGLGDRPPRLLTVVPDDAVRQRIEEFAARGCRVLAQGAPAG